MREKILKNLNRLVIKIGSSVISQKESGKAGFALNQERVRHFAAQSKKIVDSGVNEFLAVKILEKLNALKTETRRNNSLKI